MRLLVTGGAGFIGANFVHGAVRDRPNVEVTVLDAMTYAGSAESLNSLAGRIRLVDGDITDESLIAARPLLADLYPIFLAARPRPVTPYYSVLSQALQPEVSAVVVGRKTPREALDAARRQVARIIGARELSGATDGL